MSDRARRTAEVSARSAHAGAGSSAPDIDRATFGVRVPNLMEALCIPSRCGRDARDVAVVAGGVSEDAEDSLAA